MHANSFFQQWKLIFLHISSKNSFLPYQWPGSRESGRSSRSGFCNFEELFLQQTSSNEKSKLQFILPAPSLEVKYAGSLHPGLQDLFEANRIIESETTVFDPTKRKGIALPESIQNSFTRELMIRCFPVNYDMIPNGTRISELQYPP